MAYILRTRKHDLTSYDGDRKNILHWWVRLPDIYNRLMKKVISTNEPDRHI